MSFLQKELCPLLSPNSQPGALKWGHAPPFSVGSSVTAPTSHHLGQGSEALQILTDVIFCSSVRPEVRVMIPVKCEQKCVFPWGKGRALLQVHQRLGVGKYRCSTIRGSVPKEGTDKSQPISRCSENGICMSHLDQGSFPGSFTTDPISALTLRWPIQKGRR